MALTSFVSNAELSSNPAVGLVVGDTDPASTQAGALTKLRDGEDENAATIADEKTIFDSHDHDPATGTGGGGQKIGHDGVVSIATDGIDEDAIGAAAITGAKTEDAAIDATKIAGETVELAQIGAARSESNSVAAGATWTWSHGGTYLLFHVEADSYAGEDLKVKCASGSIAIRNDSLITLDVTIKYYAG